ncbi:MAG: hypothetical protein ACHBN1_26115 [Heteroscytonema crispum UTEX LB 1556]
MELFNTSEFSAKNDTARDFELENVSSKKKVARSRSKADPAWDDESAFPKISSKNQFKVGDRVLLKGTDDTGTIEEIYTADTGWIKWDNPRPWEKPDATHFICTTYLKKIGSTQCNNLTSVQESVPDFVTPGCNSDLSLSELQKPTTTAQTSLESDIQESTTTETCEASPLTEDSDLNPIRFS